jgi:hypothetical protein
LGIRKLLDSSYTIKELLARTTMSPAAFSEIQRLAIPGSGTVTGSHGTQ